MQAPERRRTEALADDEVIRRVLAGEKDRFAELVGRYQAALYRHALMIVLDRDVAADMVQDALVRTYTNLGACRDPLRFRSWLFRTLRNRCLDYLKEPRRRNVPLDRAATLVGEADGPGDVMERRRLRRAIGRALTQLPPSQREALLMRYLDGVPYDTMAELLGASVSALKMRVLRAREALSAALEQSDVTGRPVARLYTRRG